MTMKGRKPKPAAVHERNGNPSHKAKDELLNTSVGGTGRPEVPRGFPRGAEAVFTEVCDALSEAGVLDKADGLAVESLAIAIHRARSATSKLRELEKEYAKDSADREGGKRDVYTSGPNGSPHPALKVERESYATARQLFEQLGIGPTARARLGIASGGKGGRTPERDMEALVGGGSRADRRAALVAVQGGRGA